jgi:predicted AAA+ superfamily ATPase
VNRARTTLKGLIGEVRLIPEGSTCRLNSVLETTYVAHVVRPFSTRKSVEIVAAPKVYGFDTGFICYFRGWQQPRSDDLSVLWEHYVLERAARAPAE